MRSIAQRHNSDSGPTAIKPRSSSWLLLSFLFLGALFTVAPVHAQALRIFVASYGNDSNDGSRGSPKRNFQAAHDAVADGGQVVALDTAGYGRITITKSMSITVPPGVNGFVTATGPFDSGIRIFPGPSGIVSLRGLIIEGAGGTDGSPRGVSMDEGTLYIEDCIIRNFGSSGVESSFTDDKTVKVVARNVQIRNCGYGFFSSADSHATVVYVLTDCLVDGCRNAGVFAQGNNNNNSFSRTTLTRCTLTGNAIGIRSALQDIRVYADTCTLSGNGTGLQTAASGQILSRGNNTFTNNSSDGAFTGALATK